MKKLLTAILLLFALSIQAQSLPDTENQRINYDLSLGDSSLTTKNILGFSRLSFQLKTVGLDAANATIQIQKSNDRKDFLDIVGATLTFGSGTNTNFIEVENAKNAFYKAKIVVGSVTAGTIKIELRATR